MSTKVSPRPRKRKQNDDMKQEIVVQVHKVVKSNTSSENDYVNSEDNLESNKTYKIEDKNENYSIHTPSREISVDSESQINSKILSLIETEMKKDINKHSHFTDSRPQSLSFYEDEKIPEELSGNLELLSPEERKHYRKRKEYLQMDTDEMNAYNVIQDLYSTRDADEIMTSSLKKSKSRKKRHAESEMGMGDSREMMIPKEKRKSKKKKRESSPLSATNNNKRKHKKRDEDYEPRNDVTVALEELQDDVFDNSQDDFNGRSDRMKKSPRKSDKLYVQKKTKFETTTRNNGHLNRQGAQDFEDGSIGRRNILHPIEIAICYQKIWMRISNLCHGLLSGLALGHWLYLICNQSNQDKDFLLHYAYYSDIYVGLFFVLCVFCIISVFDRIDIAHLDSVYLSDVIKNKKFSIVIVIYMVCLLVHLSTTTYDEKLSLIAYNNDTLLNVTTSDIKTWNHLSLWRTVLAFTAWLIVGLGPTEDLLYSHIKIMEKYLPDK